MSSHLNSTAKKDRHVYNAEKTATSTVVDGAKWNISYGDGSYASGTVHTDQVVVGKTVVKAQAVELANNISDSFISDGMNDGLLGLGFSKGTTEGAGNTGWFPFITFPSLGVPPSVLLFGRC